MGASWAIVPLTCGHTLRLNPGPTRAYRSPFYCVRCDDYMFRADMAGPEWNAVCHKRGCHRGGSQHGQARELAERAANMHHWRSGHPVTVEYLQGRTRR